MDDRLRIAAAQLEEKKRRLEELKRMTARSGAPLVRSSSASTVIEAPPATTASRPPNGDSLGALQRSMSTGEASLTRLLDEATAMASSAPAAAPRAVARSLRTMSSVSNTVYVPVEEGDTSGQFHSSTSEAQLAAFVLRAGRLVDRALCQTDYMDLEPVYARVPATRNVETGDLQLSAGVECTLAWRRPEGGRAITCAPSASHTDLVACSYALPATDSSIQSGCVCVWHERLSTPQCELTAGAPVTALRWGDACNTSSSMLYAGSSTGSVLAWDIRLPQTRPAMECSPVADGHVSSITALLGAHTSAAFEGAASLLSLCRDGLLCTWDPRKLMTPVATCLLANSARHWHGAEVTASCMGSVQDGCIAVGYAHGKVDLTAGYGRQTETSFTASMHACEVTSVSMHAQSSSARGAAVSVCADGRASMWAYQTGAATLLTDLSSPRGAVCTLAQWAPSRAAAIVTCDDAGGVYLYDVAADLLSPTAAVQLRADAVVCSMEWCPDYDSAFYIGDSRGNLRRLQVTDAGGILGSRASSGADTLGAHTASWRSLAEGITAAMTVNGGSL